MNKQPRSDYEVEMWAITFVALKGTLLQMESLFGVSHSTMWWCFQYRLEGINKELYGQVMDQLKVNVHRRDRHDKNIIDSRATK